MEEYTIEVLDLEEEGLEVLLLEDEEGNETEVETLIAFRDEETGVEYIVYTDNQIVNGDEVEIAASKIVRHPDGIELTDMTEEEWEFVQTVVEAMEEDEI